MPVASASRALRWAAPDGAVSLAVPAPDGPVPVECGGESAQARAAGGVATLSAADAARLMPDIGLHTLSWGGDSPAQTVVERVGARYASVSDLREYGERNNDGFTADRFPDSLAEECIQQAEEAIDGGTGRSFCERAATCRLERGFNELPVQDARSVEGCELVSDRQCVAPAAGEYRVVYGAEPTARVREAALRLAASLMRPRASAENVRGQSVDGVYVSYTLPTGADGSWTGIPYVDAVIEDLRSRRRVVM